MCGICTGRPLTEMEKVQAELYKQVVLDSLIGECDDELADYWSLVKKVTGRRGYGKNYELGKQIRLHANALDSGKMGVIVLENETPTKLPQKICTYRKPKLYWFGELHPSNNFIHNPGFNRSVHWKIDPSKLVLKGRDPKDGLSVFPSMGSTTGRYEEANPLKGKRFIGISEPPEGDKIDNDFLMRFTGDDWVETRTLNKKSSEWKPQGEIIVMSGKPLKIKDKDESSS